MRTNFCFRFLDLDLYADVSFRCTEKGYAGDRIDPPYGPEFEVDELTLYLDTPRGEAPILETPKWLHSAIIESEALYDTMREYHFADPD